MFDFTPPTPCEAIDFDGSGNIGISDLLEVLNLYGSTRGEDDLIVLGTLITSMPSACGRGHFIS